MPAPSCARTAPATESAACAATLRARACQLRVDALARDALRRAHRACGCRRRDVRGATRRPRRPRAAPRRRWPPRTRILKLPAVTCARADGERAAHRLAAIPYYIWGSILTAARRPRLPAIAGPDSLDMPEHQAAHGGHRVLGGGENRRTAPQQLPALAAQDLAQILDVAVDGLDVGVASAVEDLQIPVGARGNRRRGAWRARRRRTPASGAADRGPRRT